MPDEDEIKPTTETPLPKESAAAAQQPVAGATGATGTAQPTPPAAPVAKSLAETEEVSNDALYQLKGSEFTKRLDRFSRKELKDRFGTDNYDDIKGKLDKLATFEADAETKRLATLSNEEKLKEQLNTAQREAAQAKAQLEATQVRDARRKETIRIGKLAQTAIDSTMLKYALVEFSSHLKKTYTPKQMDALTDAEIQKYFKDLAKAQPKFAKAAASAAPPPAAKPTTTLTTGARPGVARPKPPTSGTATEKTALPGKPNSMTKAEIKAKHGVSW